MPRKITGIISRTYDLASSMSVNEKTYDKQSRLNTWFKMTEDISSSGDLIDSIRGVGLTPSNDAGFRRPPYTTSIIPDRLEGVTALSLDSGYIFPIGGAGTEVVLEQKTSAIDEFAFGHNPPGPDNGFTFGFWIRFASTNVDRTILSKWHDNDTNQQQYQIRINGGQRRIQFRVFHNASSRIYQIQSSEQLDAAKWYHIAFAFSGNAADANSLKIYINGNLDKADRLRDSGNNPYSDGSIFNKSSFFAIGNDYVNYFPDRAIEAIIAELAIWTTELSANDLYVIYNMLGLDDTTKYKSGFVNLPPRIEIRNRDNATGSYPTVFRMGDKDRRGAYSTQFDDTNTIFFGRRIRDNFTLQDQDKVDGILGYTKKIDTNNWLQSGDLEIRKELYNEEGTTSQDGALVFAGPGDAEGRWLRTKVKIKNATVEADVVFGPYNESRTLLKYGLGLQSPGPTEDRGLKVQISTSGLSGTWTTIKTLTGDVESLFSESIFSSRPAFEALLQKRKRVKIKLTPSDFSGVGGSEFYLRFAQTTVSDSNQAEWAIGFVNIEYHNENVRYPLMIDPASRVGQRIATGAIATPHELPTITAPGRSISGISDVHLKFTPGEGISAFDDARINITPEDYFFQQGSDPNTIPGMSSPLWSKTQFVIDLSPSEETTFGLTSRATTSLSVNETDNTVKQQLMVYWNKDQKRWEKIAQGISANAPSDASSQLESMIASGALGFSGIDLVSTGSLTSDQKTNSSNVLSSYVRPTNVFGFPFEGKYHATSSQFITARDIGITKPFVLEKCQITFDAKFEFPKFSDNAKSAYSLIYGAGTSPYRFESDNQRVIIPTFFMMRQQEYDNFSKKIKYKKDDVGAVFVNNYRNVEIPSLNYLSTDNEEQTYIQSSRELITYGQITLYTSSSSSLATNQINIREALDKGLSRDAEVDILKLTNQTNTFVHTTENINPITGSFKINFPSRQTGKISLGSRVYLTHTGSKTGLWLDNSLGGRSYENLDSSARSLINGTPVLEFGERFITQGSLSAPTSIEIDISTANSSDLYSPYVILPEDKIIFGWQYPMLNNPYENLPGSGDIRFNSMTLFEKSKLVLYGSQLREGIEFHEGNNQNLGSDSVHEMIGSEPIVDQFEISRAIENYGNYLDNYVATSTEEPVDRVLATVQSRLTTPKGASRSGTASITIPGLYSYIPPGKKAGLNDGDLIVIKDAVGTVVHFYAFRHGPFGPAERVAGNLPQFKDHDGNGQVDTSGADGTPVADNRAWGTPSLPDPASPIFNHTADSFNNMGYGLSWAVSGVRNNSYPGQGNLFDGNTFDNFQPPGAPAGFYPPTQVYSFRIDGGRYDGFVNFSSSEKVNTLNNLLSAIQDSSLRVDGSVSLEPLALNAILNLTLTDGGTSGQHQILKFNAKSLYIQLDDNYYFSSFGFSGANDLLDASLGSFVRVSPTQDAIRVYSDSLLTGSYGSFQTAGAAIRPKYYLDSRKYGQHIHFIEQAKDSKSKVDLKTRRFNLIDSSKGEAIESPVKIDFLSGSTSDSLAVRGFRRTDSSLTSAVNKTRNSNLTGSFLD